MALKKMKINENKPFQNLLNKEILILFYFIFLNLGVTSGFTNSFYNEFRAFQIIILLAFSFHSLFNNRFLIKKIDLIFLFFIIIGSFFWQEPIFVITELILAYLLYKSFEVLDYNSFVTKVIVLSGFLLFTLLPLSLFEYLKTGLYNTIWYPLPWNIRLYDSYFLILCIFATWFYITEKKYNIIYLVLICLAFFTILLDAGRSATLAYTAFVLLVIVFNKSERLPLIFTYSTSWLAYIAITYATNIGSSGLRIARESSSGRVDLWINALQCWSQHPVIGCGFYQLEKFPHLSAHPHNLFIQILTETGLIGFSFLAFIIITIAKSISWNFKENYFVIAALLAVGIDSSLSGIHIYPITQVALLWLFVFLLKKPNLSNTQYFDNNLTIISHLQSKLSIMILTLITIFLSFIILQSFTFDSDMLLTPPRFWGYGYQLF